MTGRLPCNDCMTRMRSINLIAFALQISDFGNFLIEQGNLLDETLIAGLLVIHLTVNPQIPDQ